MEFIFNREKSSFIKVLKGKCEKESLKCSVQQDKIRIETFMNADGKLEDAIPAVFQGRIEQKESTTVLKGRMSNGFYLSGMFFVAALLIIVRLSWSIYQKQMDNVILSCGAMAILIIVGVVIQLKGKKSKERISNLLSNLQEK